MKIAVFSEANFFGKTPRNIENCRTEYAWYIGLDAYHHSLFSINTLSDTFDFGLVILPKKNISAIMSLDILTKLKKHCKKIALIQEGPSNFFEDYELHEQVWYYNFIREIDLVLCHNYSDVNYFEGMFDIPTYPIPSLMIEDNLKDIQSVERKNVIIGGNMCSWYGGLKSFLVSTIIGEQIYAPSMGRKIQNEDKLGIVHLPFMNWREWIYALNNFKYAVHLMPTAAAGTFSMNCAFLGIPCISNEKLDTQNLCFPELSVDVNDVVKAKKLLLRLKEDKDFYQHCSENGKIRYKKYYSENVWIEYMNKILENYVVKN